MLVPGQPRADKPADCAAPADAVRPARPRTIKRALQAIHAHPEQPLTTAALAALSGVSVRTVQEGFRRHVGMPPMAYLRDVRLAHVHDDLRTGKVRSVAQAAHRWGFNHLGRFAAAYQHRYGVAPSATLHLGEPSAAPTETTHPRPDGRHGDRNVNGSRR
jgi:transcriptional regulator GlxA family with amidase domain